MFKFNVRPVTWAIFVHFVLFISCKKQTDNSLPVLELTSPFTMQNFTAGDTVLVSAKIRDDKMIKNVSIRLKNEDHISVLSQSIPVNSPAFELNVSFPLKDLSLNGKYYFDVTAYDESDYSSVYCYVQIGELKKEGRRIVLFSENSQNTEMYKWSGKEFVLLKSFFGDLLETSSKNDRAVIYSMGMSTGDLNAMDSSGNVIWSYPSNGSMQFPFFSDLSENTEITVGLRDGRIMGFNEGGQKISEKVLESGYMPGKLQRHEDRIIYEEIQKASGKNQLVDAYFPSAQLYDRIVFNYGKVCDFFSLSWNKMLILSNTNNEQFILNFDLEKHTLSQLFYQIGFDQFHSAVKISNNKIAVLKGDELMIYDVETNDLSTLKSNLQAKLIRFDEAENTLWCLTSQQLIALNANNGQEISSIEVPIGTKSFEILYFY